MHDDHPKKKQSQWPREKPVRLAPFFIIVCQWSCPGLQKNGGLLVYLLKWWCCAMQTVNVKPESSNKKYLLI